MAHPARADLLEVVMDLGRRPEARFTGEGNMELIRDEVVTQEELDAATAVRGQLATPACCLFARAASSHSLRRHLSLLPPPFPDALAANLLS